MVNTSTKKLTLFYCYASEDAEYWKRLDQHLHVLKEVESIETYSSKDIHAGMDTEQRYRELLERADIILLLISADFLSSEQCQRGLAIALARRDAGQALVIPVLLKPVDWEGAAFSALQPVPTNRISVTQWSNEDAAFQHITEQIRRVVTVLRQPKLMVIIASSVDHAFVARLQHDLEAQAKLITPLEISLIDSEEQREAVFHDAMSSASTLLFVASPETPYSRMFIKYMDLARSLPKNNVIIVWMAGDEWSEIAPIGWEREDVIDARNGKYEDAVKLMLRRLAHVTLSTTFRPSTIDAAPQLVEPRNPYKGLRAFTAQDARDFFGREKLVQELLTTVQQCCVQPRGGKTVSRLLAIVGPSGSGKSSIAMAGLLPALQRNVTKPRNWVYLDPIFPGKKPLEALAISLAKYLSARGPVSIQHDLAADSQRALHLLTSHIASCFAAERVVLLIDQFEELFTLTELEDERQQFIGQIVTAVTEPRGPLVVLVTLRADFYDRPMQYPALYQLMQSHQMVVLPMDITELRTAIVAPAALPDVQLEFEDSLLFKLLVEMHQRPGALPLLQFVLEELVRRRVDNMLTEQAYQEMGGVKGALEKHAEAVYSSLSSPLHKDIARALFLRLVDAGSVDQDASKRRVPLSELELSDPKKSELVAEIRKIFTNERLLTTNTIANVPTIELSHEALITVWPRLITWLQESREDNQLQSKIRQDALEWLWREKHPDRLYRRSQLAEALDWRKRNLPNQLEETFLQACLDRQKKITRRTVLGGVAAVSLAGVGFSLARQLLLPSPSIPGIQKLPYIYTGHTDSVNSVAWSPDRKRIASGSRDKTVQVWDATSGMRLQNYAGHTSSVLSVAWSPDGKFIASGGADQTVQMWDPASGMRLQTYQGNHIGSVYSVVWSPDGKRIASSGGGDSVRMWDVVSAKCLHIYKDISTESVFSIGWSPDGKQIASSGGGAVQVWNVSSGKLLHIYGGHYISSVAWSSDSTHIAAGCSNGMLQVWKVASRKLLHICNGHGLITSVAWSPDGKRIVLGSNGGRVQVWDAASGTLLQNYDGHTGPVNSVVWSPDGRRIASGGNDHTVQEWFFSITNALHTYDGQAGSVNSIAWSPDSQRIISGSEDGRVRIWDVSSGAQLQTYTGHEAHILNVVWSLDSQRIVSGDNDYVVQVWDVASGRLLQTYKNGHLVALTSDEKQVVASTGTVPQNLMSVKEALNAYSGTGASSFLALAPDSRRIAFGNTDGVVQIWDTASATLLHTYPKSLKFVVNSVAWSPDGNHVVFGCVDGTQVWNAASNTLLHLYKASAGVDRVVWSQDGRLIVSRSEDGSAQVWDVASGRLLRTHTDFFGCMALAPDSRRIAYSRGDGTVQVWDVNSDVPLQNYNGRAGMVNSIAWSPDGTYLAFGNGDGTVQVWVGQ